MFSPGLIKKTAFITVILFACLVCRENVVFAQSEDVLTTVKRHMQQGDFKAALDLLNRTIDEKTGVSGQEKNLAEAYYLLAKVYFKASAGAEKIQESIIKVFEIYPEFTQNEDDMYFQDEFQKMKTILIKEGKIKEPEPVNLEPEKDNEPGEKMIEKTKEKKKKKFPVLLVAGGIVVLTVLVLLLTKKKKPTLIVTMSGGVTGSPAAGSYSYKKGAAVNYSYTRNQGYANLQVKLDGAIVPTSGTLTMDRDHTLDASAARLGTITGVTVECTVTFAGENLQTRHKISVDNVEMINPFLNFTQHYNENHDWDQLQKIVHIFTFNKNLGPFTIKQEAATQYGWFYRREGLWIGSTQYDLKVTNYTYINGIDPGKPTLSEALFFLHIAPWEEDPNSEWYRIKTKTITLNPAATASFQEQDRKELKPKVCAAKK